MKQKLALFTAICYALSIQAEQLPDVRVDFKLGATCGVCDDFDPPIAATGINTDGTIQKGGAPYVAILDAKQPLTDQLVLANWDAAIVANQMVLLRNCLDTGGIEPQQTTEELGSCLTPVVTEDRLVYTFSTFVDNATYDRFKLMQYLRGADACYLVSIADCDGKPHPFFPATIAAPAYQKEDTKAGKSRWTLVITFEAKDWLPPLAVAWNIKDVATA